MEWTRPFSIAIVVLVVLWAAGAIAELFLTTFSVGPNVWPAALSVVALLAVLAVATAIGARGRRRVSNPGYW